MNKLKHTKFNEPRLQKVVLTLFALFAVVNVGIQIYSATLEFPYNQSFSSLLMPIMWAIFPLLLPLLIFSISLAMRSRDGSLVTRAFDALIVTVGALVLQIMLNMILQPLFQFSIINTGDFWPYILYKFAQMVFVCILTVSSLYWLKQRNYW